MLVSCEAHRDTLAHQYVLYTPMVAAKENGAAVEVEPWGMADAISQEVSTMEDRDVERTTSLNFSFLTTKMLKI